MNALDLANNGATLFADYESNKFTKNTYYKSTSRNVIYDEYYFKRSKKIIDEIDKCIAKYYNFQTKSWILLLTTISSIVWVMN